MRTFFRWVGTLILVFVLAIIIAGVVAYFLARNNLDKTYNDVVAETIALPEGDTEVAAALERGEHLAFAISLCADCHGDDLGGKSFIDDVFIGKGDAPNLTSGTGGIGASYTTDDWVRAIRHGVKPDDTPIVFMPTSKYYQLNDSDLAAIIAYVQSVPPVDRETRAVDLGPMGTILVGVVMDLPAEDIDHTAARPAVVEPGVTTEYGEYLVTVAACQDCHGDKLDGKLPPGAPAGPDLRPTEGLSGWTEADFANTMRTGITPYGETLDREDMPWHYYGRMTDEELSAIWAYLQTLG